MPSPFPGMDPYLEDPAFWQDFHHTFITWWRELLVEVLPDHYEARIDEQIQLVEIPLEEARLVRPDVAVMQHPEPATTRARAGGTATLEPVTVPHVLIDEIREGYIKILHREDRSVVTVLELLSPTNKADPHRGEYLSKRYALLGQEIHVVELDLLIGGKRLPMREALPPGHYYAFVSRSNARPNCDVFAWTIRDPLPRIPIPLRAPDADVNVDLSEVFAKAYRSARFDRALNYAEPPPAPLEGEELQRAADRTAAGSP